MVKTILTDALEQLEQIPQGAAKQAMKLPQDFGKTAISQVTGVKKRVDPLTGIEIPDKKKLQELKKKEGKKKQSGLSQARTVISQTKPGVQPAPQQIPAYVTGKPGFALEPKQPKKELPPPVSAHKPSMGTGEIKRGVSG